MSWIDQLGSSATKIGSSVTTTNAAPKSGVNVSGVAAAVGKVADLLSNTINTYSNKLSNSSFYQRLGQYGPSQWNDFFSPYSIDNRADNQRTIYVMAGVVALIVLAVAFSSPKKNT